MEFTLVETKDKKYLRIEHPGKRTIFVGWGDIDDFYADYIQDISLVEKYPRFDEEHFIRSFANSLEATNLVSDYLVVEWGDINDFDKEVIRELEELYKPGSVYISALGRDKFQCLNI